VEIETERFFPEGSTVDAAGNFYVGSMDLGSIVKIPAGTTAAESFIDADEDNELVSVLGLFADDVTNTLWVCSSDAGNAQRSGTAPVAIKAFELDTGAFVTSYAWPEFSGEAVEGATVNGFCNDITVADDGTLYATDSWYPRILRLAEGETELEEWVVSDVFPQDQWHLNGIDVDEASGTVYAVENHPGALYAIEIDGDGSAGTVTEIATSRPLLSPDGLKVVGEGLLAAAEGQPGGMVTIEVAGDSGTVRRISTGLDGIATFAMLDGSAWLVENQGDHFWNPDGAGPDANKPFRLVEVPLNLP
jgi:sugar lactone lactonase YvrE